MLSLLLIPSLEKKSLFLQPSAFNSSQSKNLMSSNKYTLCIPMECKKRTLECFKGKRLFEATLQLTHSLYEKGLEDISNATGNNDWNLCWIIPTEVFGKFKEKKVNLWNPSIKITQYKLDLLWEYQFDILL